MEGKHIIIIGVVGTTKNIIEQLYDAKINHGYPISSISILIDSLKKGELVSGAEVVGSTGDIEEFLKRANTEFVFSLHKPEVLKERLELLNSFNIPLERYFSFVHPLSYASSTSKIGKGTIILSNSTIQSGVTMGSFNIVNSNVTIEHDSSFGDFNFIAANSCIGANVKAGNCNFIGINSSIRENTILGENVFIGMHSLVLNNASDCRIVGVPARPL